MKLVTKNINKPIYVKKYYWHVDNYVIYYGI